MSFYTSLTGLNAASSQLGVTSNNIANVGTTGFKRSRIDFGDIFASSPLQRAASTIGQGVALKQVRQEFSQGNISTSGNTLDLAITGDGFFQLSIPPKGDVIYTRNGTFQLNNDNVVVNSAGQQLVVAKTDAVGNANFDLLEALRVPPRTVGQAEDTKQVQLGVNLPTDSLPLDPTKFDREKPETYSKNMALTVYDVNGTAYLATIYFVKTENGGPNNADSKWQTFMYVNNELVRPSLMPAQQNGAELFVNKYGEVLPKTDSRVIPPIGGGVPMYRYDMLFDARNQRTSFPASVNSAAKLGAGNVLSITPSNSVPGTTTVTLPFTFQGNDLQAGYTSKAADRYPEVFAKNLEAIINREINSDGTRVSIGVDYSGSDFSFRVTQNSTGLLSANDIAQLQARLNGVSNSGSTPPLNHPNPVNIKASWEAAYKPSSAANNINFTINVDGMLRPAQISYVPLAEDANPAVFAKNLEVFLAKELSEQGAVNSRFGVKVAFNSGTNTFEFTSGSTGDQSSVRIDNPNARAQEIFTFATGNVISTPVSDEAFRGVPSSSAKLEGSSVQISNINAPIRLDSTNNKFFVFVNGIRANIEIDAKEYANVDAVAAELKAKINSVYDLATGMKVSGVDVRFNRETRGFTFETATQGAGSSILVIGDKSLGLDNLTIATSVNSTWTQLQQHLENGRVQFVQNGVAAESVELARNVEWYPLYLDPGELSFSGGKLLSPNPGMKFDAFKLGAGVKDLSLTIDYSKTRESNAPFTVFAQNQDGRPEGDLLGLDIGDDGTVTATYSNATQDRLGKIVLVSFPTPTGLRQIGDSSFLATQASGNPRIGEPGTSGFGSIRSGAIERSNVDLTQELVDLITSQRNFQANAKAIETNSTMTQSIINIRA